MSGLAQFIQFLPIGPAHAVPNPQPSKPHRHPQAQKPPAGPSDPERTPERQLARRLGNYGANILRDSIKVDYENQFKKWHTHIGHVTTSFSLALGHQASAMKKDELERRAKAEMALLMFSLVTAGVMRWAGTFVQYKLYPKFFNTGVSNQRTVAVQDVPGVWKYIKVHDVEYDKQIAAFVGGLVMDVGNPTLRYISSRQRMNPFAGLAEDDFVSAVRLTQEALEDALEDGVSVVKKEMDEAIVWMNQSAEFGDRWAAFVNQNESSARQRIHSHLQSVRNNWASRWPMFGQDPKPIAQVVLSNAFERALWATYIDRHFTEAFKHLGKWQGVGPYSPEDVFLKKMDRNQTHFSVSLVIGEAIVNRLQLLNLVQAHRYYHAIDQLVRKLDEGAPEPTVDVGIDVDTFDEVRALWRWARNYPSEVSHLVRNSGAEGVARRLPSIPTYQ